MEGVTSALLAGGLLLAGGIAAWRLAAGRLARAARRETGEAAAPGPPPTPDSASLDPVAPAAGPPAAWIPPGSGPIDIAGYAIAGGMLYVGEHLPPVAEIYGEDDPALIDPRLPVDQAPPSLRGEDLACWPAYSALSPASRSAFLYWLAGGRCDPDASIGYVFLFLYGLERRLLAADRRAPIARGEMEALEAEILRLRDLYGESRSFRGYATGLLGAMWMGADVRVYERFPPPTEPRAGELPVLLRLGLGQLIRDARPIPADWALAWALADPEAQLPSDLRRRPDPIRERFHARYAETFGEGMVRGSSGRELSVHYRPASASFGGGVVLDAPGVPDVAPLREPVQKLHRLLADCLDEPGTPGA